MIALTRIKSHVREYKKGEALGNEFSSEELKRLVRLNVIDGAHDVEEDYFFGEDPTEFLTEEELGKIPNKAKLIEYAQSIGLDELSEKMSREEITSSILNYIEEMEDHEEFEGHEEQED